MGSMVVNYYRKRDQQDEHVPKVREKLFRRHILRSELYFYSMTLGSLSLSNPMISRRSKNLVSCIKGRLSRLYTTTLFVCPYSGRRLITRIFLLCGAYSS